MNRTENQFRIAMEILRTYKGREPFHLNLKKEFKTRRSGSSDRRFIRTLCYCALRVKKAMPKDQPEKTILLGILLTVEKFDEPLRHLLKTYGKEGWETMDAQPLDARRALLKDEINLMKIFPLIDRISRSVEREKLVVSHLTQPLTWIRVVSRKREAIKEALTAASLAMVTYPDVPDAIGLEPSVNLEVVLQGFENDYEVQDISSQRTVTGISLPEKPVIWDCCAGSGGKSIALYNTAKHGRFFVSDNRLNILKNLSKRFRSANLTNYCSLVTDLCDNQSNKLEFVDTDGQTVTVEPGYFDLILADVPCSGSGTWGRSPEWLSRFRPSELDEYTRLQQKIITGILPFLKPGGELVYLTCSVYSPENEQMTDWIQNEFGLQLIDSHYEAGYAHRADTMYRARFTMPVMDVIK